MIDISQNTVLGPIFKQEYEECDRKARSEGKQEGWKEGWKEGRYEGMRDLLQEQFTVKFSSVPGWAMQQLREASIDDLHTWAKRVVRSTSLEDTLR